MRVKDKVGHALLPVLIAEIFIRAFWDSAWVSPIRQSVIRVIGFYWFIAIPKIIAFAILLLIFLEERGRERVLGADKHAMTLNGILKAAAIPIIWYIVWTIFAALSGVKELYISSLSPRSAALLKWQYESSSLLSRLTVSLIIAPIIEELMFRGLLQKRLQRFAPTWVAIFVSAALFALFHGIGIRQFTRLSSGFCSGRFTRSIKICLYR